MTYVSVLAVVGMSALMLYQGRTFAAAGTLACFVLGIGAGQLYYRIRGQ